MTRTETLEQYVVSPRGRITSPGKYEAEPVWVPHFWEDVVLDGSADEESDEGPAYVQLTQQDIAEWPELTNDPDITASLDGVNPAYLMLWEDDHGFVYAVVRAGFVHPSRPYQDALQV